MSSSPGLQTRLHPVDPPEITVRVIRCFGVGWLRACLEIPRSVAADISRRILPGEFHEFCADLRRRLRFLKHALIARARRLYANEPLGVELAQTVYALDSTTIDLCLNLFPWARFRSTKGVIKLHTLLDLRGPIPTMIAISDGKQADVRVLDELVPEPGAFYVMDRGYLDFERLYRFVLAAAFFVTRTKAGVKLNRLESRPVDRTTGVRSDHIVWLVHPKSVAHYPDRLRRVTYRNPEDGKVLIFLTNNFDSPAEVIAQLYKCRWQS